MQNKEERNLREARRIIQPLIDYLNTIMPINDALVVAADGQIGRFEIPTNEVAVELTYGAKSEPVRLAIIALLSEAGWDSNMPIEPPVNKKYFRPFRFSVVTRLYRDEYEPFDWYNRKYLVIEYARGSKLDADAAARQIAELVQAISTPERISQLIEEGQHLLV
jgi:hypothetical protein